MTKRFFNITAFTTVQDIVSPVYFIIAYEVKKSLCAPVLFRQTRHSLEGKTFEMVKFFSMRESIGGEGNNFPDNKHLTPFGQTIPNTSLYELPKLWNVIKGDIA